MRGCSFDGIWMGHGIEVLPAHAGVFLGNSFKWNDEVEFSQRMLGCLPVMGFSSDPQYHILNI
jgi:hypothetical protein